MALRRCRSGFAAPLRRRRGVTAALRRRRRDASEALRRHCHGDAATLSPNFVKTILCQNHWDPRLRRRINVKL